MINNRFERLPAAVALSLAVLAVAACAIRLRGDESTTQSSALLTPKADATAAKIEQCRTVTYEQKEALLECQKIWAEQRSQFLRGGGSPEGLDSGASRSSFSSHVPRKDESRLPSLSPSIPTPRERARAGTGVIDQFLETFTRYSIPDSAWSGAKSAISPRRSLQSTSRSRACSVLRE